MYLQSLYLNTMGFFYGGGTVRFPPFRIYIDLDTSLPAKVTIQGKIFQNYTHLFYCIGLSLGCNVNTRRMSQPDMGSIFHIKKNKRNILVKGNYYVNYQNFQNSMLISSSDIKLTLMHLFLLTNSNHRELVSICTHALLPWLPLHF